MNRIFLLSPAKAGGKRAQMLTRPGASFELARRVQIGDASLGEVFAFCSGLYFRGKLTYATLFCSPPKGLADVQIITPSRGLVSANMTMSLRELKEFAAVDVDVMEPRFTEPLITSVRQLAAIKSLEVVLGSIATGKYVDCLLPILGPRLLFPGDFVGRGDMSRGALLLRCAARGEELAYMPIAGATLRGFRPKRSPPVGR